MVYGSEYYKEGLVLASGRCLGTETDCRAGQRSMRSCRPMSSSARASGGMARRSDQSVVRQCGGGGGNMESATARNSFWDRRIRGITNYH